jgi:magnesium-transporting ATPase (P-type)
MNDTGKVGCYVVILLLMGVFYVCVHIAEFLIKYFTSWQILFGGFAIIALVFMAIALYAEHFKLPPRYNKYATLSYEKKKKLPRFKFYKIFWGVLFWLGIGLCILSCTCDLTSMEVVTTHETKEWNAKNIPIPYLKDRTQYVSNPDTVITQATVNSMNEILGKLESECGIQSIVVIVNHVEMPMCSEWRRI